MPKQEDEKSKSIAAQQRFVDGVIYESILWQGYPTFLAYNTKTKKWNMADEIQGLNEKYIPVPAKCLPYRQYVLDSATWKQLQDETYKVDKQELYDLMKDEFDYYLDCPEKYKVLDIAQVFESYLQFKLTVLGYLYITGLPESGKSNLCDLLALLSYRPLKGIDFNKANVYNYFGCDPDEEGQRTIIQDEIDPSSDNKEDANARNTIYRAGYQKGNKVPRILDAGSSERIQVYYNCYGTKTLCGYSIPTYDRALCRRIIEQPMVPGNPECDDKPIEKAKVFDEIKLKILIWRMTNYAKPLPELYTDLVKGNKERWKCKLQAIWLYGLEGLYGFKEQEDSEEEEVEVPVDLIEEAKNPFEIIYDFAHEDIKTKANERMQSLEAKIVQAVYQACEEVDWQGRIVFKIIWAKLLIITGLTEAPDGTTNDDKVNKTSVGLIIRRILKGEKGFDPDPKIGRYYRFDRDFITRLAKAYGVDK